MTDAKFNTWMAGMHQGTVLRSRLPDTSLVILKVARMGDATPVMVGL